MRTFSLSSRVDSGQPALRALSWRCRGAGKLFPSLWLMKTIVKNYANISATSRALTGTRPLTPSGGTQCGRNCVLTVGAGVPETSDSETHGLRVMSPNGFAL